MRSARTLFRTSTPALNSLKSFPKNFSKAVGDCRFELPQWTCVTNLRALKRSNAHGRWVSHYSYRSHCSPDDRSVDKNFLIGAHACLCRRRRKSLCGDINLIYEIWHANVLKVVQALELLEFRTSKLELLNWKLQIETFRSEGYNFSVEKVSTRRWRRSPT